MEDRQRNRSLKNRGSDVYWEKKRDSLRRMFSKSRKPSRYDSYGRLVASTSQLNLYSASYVVAPPRPMSLALSYMFGGHLRDSVDEETGVSKFVLWCVSEIEVTGDGLHTDAIYRASGNQGRVQLIVYTSEQDMREVLSAEDNINVLTGALKLFFRRLKSPIVDYRNFDRAFQSESPSEDLRLLINGLPSVERNTLAFLLQHLCRVLTLQSVNKMGVASLGVVFGPTLMRLTPDSANMAADMKQQNRIFEHLLVNYAVIFPQHARLDANIDVNSLSDDDDVKRRSDSDVVDGSRAGRRASSVSSASDDERKSIAAIDQKLRAVSAADAGVVLRPRSVAGNSVASSRNRPATIKYSSSSSESDSDDARRQNQATYKPVSVPVRPAPSVQDAGRTPVANGASSITAGNVSAGQPHGNAGNSNSRPASVSVRPSAIPPAPPSATVNRNPVSHQTSSSESDNDGPKVSPIRIEPFPSIGQPLYTRPVHRFVPTPPVAPASPLAPTPPLAPTHSIPPTATTSSVKVAKKNHSGNRTSSSDSDKSDSERQNVVPGSGTHPKAKVVPPALPSTPVPILVVRKSVSRDDRRSSESDSSDDDKRRNVTAIGSSHPKAKVVPPALPSTPVPILVVRKSVSRDGRRSSVSDSSDNERKGTATGQKYVDHKVDHLRSGSREGKYTVNKDYEPIYSNQDEIDANYKLAYSNDVDLRNSKLKDESIASSSNPADALYDIDTYKNRQLQRLTAAFDLPSDMDSASAFSRQIADHRILASLDSSRRMTNVETSRHIVLERPEQGLASSTSAEYATVSHQQKIKQTSYKHQSKTVNVTQQSSASRRLGWSSDSSISLSDSDDSQRGDNRRPNQVVRNVPTAI